MKKLILICNVAICFAIVSPSIFLTSCKSTGDIVTNQQESADQIILRAEQTAQTAKATETLFVHLEHDNELALKQFNPKIHEYANYVRLNGRAQIRSLLAAIDTFKANRNNANQATLATWLNTINNVISQTKTYLEQSKSVQTTNP